MGASLLQSPRPGSNRTLIADWWELKALAAPLGSFRVEEMKTAFGLEADVESEDFIGADKIFEDAYERAASEIQWRMECLNSAYPFEFSSGGSEIRVIEEYTPGRDAYFLCLGLSHSNRGELSSEGLKVANYEGLNVRKLFQACATLCAAGFMEGPALWFDSPREEDSMFLAKLKTFVELFGEGRAVESIPEGAPRHVQDGGVDVVAWRELNDNSPGKILLLGQSASGDNWRCKPIMADAHHFLGTWFAENLSSRYVDAMFHPFCWEPECGEGGDWRRGVKAKLANYTKNFGVIYYRNRLPYYVEKGVQLESNTDFKIEGITRLEELRKWCVEFRRNLQESSS